LVFDLPLTLESKNSAFDKSLTSFFRVWLPDEILKNEEQHNVLGKCTKYGALWRGGCGIKFLSNIGSKLSKQCFLTNFSMDGNTPTYGVTPE
jgi:hypothetical protein